MHTQQLGFSAGPICLLFGLMLPPPNTLVREVFYFRTCPSVSKSVRPENLFSIISQKPIKGISLNFGHRCIWVHRYADYILGPKSQRSRSQQQRRWFRLVSVSFHTMIEKLFSWFYTNDEIAFQSKADHHPRVTLTLTR